MIRNDLIYPKMLIIGHARHGKDTVAELLRDEYGFIFTSSSLFCADKIVAPAFIEWRADARTPRARIVEAHLGRPGIVQKSYASTEECYADRSNHRALWFDLISHHNREDAAKLAGDIFEHHDVYVGVRSKREFHAAVNEGLADIVVWVDRSDKLPLEPKSSMQLEPWMADYVIDNNGTLAELRMEVHRLVMARLHSVAENHR